MIRLSILGALAPLCLCALAPTTASAAAAPARQVPAQGRIGIVERGAYSCEVPGRATGAASIPQPEADFRIDNSSRYASKAGTGTYLRRGDIVAFTSGPRQGEQFLVISPTFLRRMDQGRLGRLRCIHSGR